MLIGDVGGLVQPGSYNLSFMLDGSGSISDAEFTLMKSAVFNLLGQFSGATSLHVDIGLFAANSLISGQYYTSVAAAQHGGE